MSIVTDEKLNKLAFEFSEKHKELGESGAHARGFKSGWHARTEHMQKLSEDQENAILKGAQDQLQKFYDRNKIGFANNLTKYISTDFVDGAKFGIALDRATSEKLREENEQLKATIACLNMDGKGQQIEIEKLRKDYANLSASIHTCHEGCKVAGCVNVKLRKALEVKEAEPCYNRIENTMRDGCYSRSKEGCEISNGKCLHCGKLVSHIKDEHAKKALTELRDFKSEAMDLIRFYSFGTNPFDDRSKVEVRDGISTEWSKDRMRHGKRAREFIEKWRAK